MAFAQTYSKTETIEYSDNLTTWVLGQVKRTTTNGIEVSRINYNAAALPAATYSFGKLRQSLAYNVDGTIATVKDGGNHVTAFSGWKRGVPQTITYPATTDQPTAVMQKATVDDNGWITSITDENGFKTCYGYDAMGRVSRITYPSESAVNTCDTSTWSVTTQIFQQVASAEYGIPANHWRQTISTGNGRTVTYFDAMWRPLVEDTYDSANVANTRSISAKRYDASGRLVFQSYPRSSLSSYSDTTLTGTGTSYDALNRVTRVAQSSELGVLPTTIGYLSNTSGPYTLVTNPRGYQTRTWYQAFDQPDLSVPVEIWQPEGVYTDITRDAFGKPLSLTQRNAAGTIHLARSYVYDANQLLCKTFNPEAGATITHYDASGNMDWSASGLALPSTTSCDTTSSIASARMVARAYDARNRMQALRFPDGRGDTTYQYWPDGQVRALTTDNGGNQFAVTSYEYNRRRLLTRERLKWKAIFDWPIDYTYNANGHLASQAWHGIRVDYAPNALGQPTGAGTFASGVSYYPNGAIKQFTYGNGIVHTMLQDVRQLPDTSRDTYGATQYIDDGYDYDDNGNVAAITDGTAGIRGNRDMTYDGRDRLKTAISPMFDGTTASYTYDVLDDLTHVVAPGRNQYLCYDGNGRLTSVKTGSCSGSTVTDLDYDVQGNLNNKSSTAYDFDYGNRLRRVGSATSPVSQFAYDGLGRRVWDYTTDDGYIQYNHNGHLVMGSDERRGIVSEYIYLGGSLIAIRERDVPTATYTVKYQHTDALGSPVAVTNQSRTILVRRDYEPYGKPLNQPVTDVPGYAGHMMDSATGLSYMQQRYYDPDIGRFLSVDPVGADGNTGGNFNRYWYANNNPYRFTDPDGRCPNKQGCNEAIPYSFFRNTFLGRVASNALGNLVAVFSPTNTNPLSGEALDRGQLQDAKLGILLFASPAPSKTEAVAGDVLRPIAGEVAEAFHYTFGKSVSSITEHGLRPGSFATTTGELSPLQAHINLALRPNRGLPDALLKIDIKGMRQAGFEIPEATQAARNFGMPGGDPEMQFPYAVPPEFISVVPK